MASIEKRVSNTGEVTFRVKVRMKGHPTQTATFHRLTDARKWGNSTESAIHEGRHFQKAEAKRHTLGQLIDKYIANVLPSKPKSLKKQKSQLLWWKSQIGAYTLADITPALIAEQRDKLAQGKTNRSERRSPSTVTRYMAALSHALTIGVKEWGWLEDSPMRKVSKPKEPRGRVRFLSDGERTELLNACREIDPENLYTIVVLALATGMRQGEILTLKWEDVHIGERCIILHETKNGERRRIPLSRHALEAIEKANKVRHLDTPLVFPHRNPRLRQQPFEVRTPWLKATKQAKLADFRFHDLRHSAASYLAMNGASLAEIAEVLGHKTLQMVKRYAHLSEAHTSKVVESMNERIFG